MGDNQAKGSTSKEKKIFASYFLTYIEEDPLKSGFAGKLHRDDKDAKPQEVFIRRYILSGENQKKISERDLDVLRRSDARVHENFIRFYVSIKESNFVYAATEYLPYSVEDLFKKELKADLKNICKELGVKEILRQSTEGLAYLHSLGYLHRNLHPSVFRIATYSETIHSKLKTYYQIKISDFRMIKNFNDALGNSVHKDKDGWMAPESLDLGVFLDKSVDVFILGTYYYYVLFGGYHPFDNSKNNTQPRNPLLITRMQKIQSSNHPIYTTNLLNNHDELEEEYNNFWLNINRDSQQISIRNGLELIRKMIQYKPDERIRTEQIMKEPFFLPDDSYDIYYDNQDNQNTTRKPGLALIFCQKKFDTKFLSDVLSHEHDRDLLDTTFRKLGFHVEKHTDLTAAGIQNQISTTAKNKDILSKYDSLVVCLLSHGDSEAVYGTDGQRAPIHQLQYAFNSHDCPAMHDNPKIFIVQACRVPKNDVGIFQQIQDRIIESIKGKSTDDPEAAKGEFYSLLSKLEQYVDTSANLSPVNDFLFCMATVKGNPAYSGSKGPSDFTDCLCSSLLEGCGTKDLDSILLEVQEKMTEKKVKGTSVQTPERISSLRKKIYLKKVTTSEAN